MRKEMPLSLMDCLARLMRRVMVASGTRNARATSVVEARINTTALVVF
jgi:hypothetical protein